MEETSRHDIATPPLHAVLSAARDFGLSEDDVWRTVAETQRMEGPEATVTGSLDELIVALARTILEKERRALAARRRAASSVDLL
jgi:hypothetical protein